MDSNATLIDLLRDRQRLLGESEKDFAKRLGISTEAWRGARRGTLPLGAKALRGVVAAFPDLRKFACDALFLHADVRVGNHDVSSVPVEAKR